MVLQKIKRSTREYYGKVEANKLDNLHEKKKFLASQWWSKCDREEMENINTYSKNSNWMSNFKMLLQENPFPDGFTGQFH